MTEATQRQTFRLVVNGDQARESIAGEVRAELARQHVSDAEVAACLGQNQQWFNRRKNGQVAFRADELAVVAAYLGVEVGQFFGRVISAPRPDGEPVGPAGLEPATYGLQVPGSAFDTVVLTFPSWRRPAREVELVPVAA
jgi:hypothetical protein